MSEAWVHFVSLGLEVILPLGGLRIKTVQHEIP
jgi:hypothetical protein